MFATVFYSAGARKGRGGGPKPRPHLRCLTFKLDYMARGRVGEGVQSVPTSAATFSIYYVSTLYVYIYIYIPCCFSKLHN